MMDEKFMYDVSEWEQRDKEDYGGKSEPPATLLSALEGINTVSKYLKKFDVDENPLAAISSTENEVYRVQQKVKQQQPTLKNK
jgi:hypothetical protein